jgi:nucleotide-binding universal stress UspA family protein
VTPDSEGDVPLHHVLNEAQPEDAVQLESLQPRALEATAPVTRSRTQQRSEGGLRQSAKPLADRRPRAEAQAMPKQDEHFLAGPPRRILIPVDGDPPAGAAFNHAVALAEALQAQLLVLGIKQPGIGAYPVPPGMVVTTEEITAAEEEVDKLAHERVLEALVRVPASVQTHTIYGRAPAGEAIVAAAREEAADLIVVPMRPGGELSHLLHDGVDRHVLHHSPVPVLVVPDA